MGGGRSLVGEGGRSKSGWATKNLHAIYKQFFKSSALVIHYRLQGTADDPRSCSSLN